jgi:hypothetical protein
MTMMGSRSTGVLRIMPVKGMVLVFHHPIWHRGDPIIAGCVWTELLVLMRVGCA